MPSTEARRHAATEFYIEDAEKKASIHAGELIFEAKEALGKLPEFVSAVAMQEFWNAKKPKENMGEKNVHFKRKGKQWTVGYNEDEQKLSIRMKSKSKTEVMLLKTGIGEWKRNSLWSAVQYSLVDDSSYITTDFALDPQGTLRSVKGFIDRIK